MSEKPCGCGKTQPQTESVIRETAKPEIVPLPPAVRARTRALRATYQEQLPDYLVAALVPLPEGAEPENKE